MNFKNTYVFKKNGVLSTMVVLQVNGCIHVIWLMFLGDSEFDHKDLRENPFEEGEFDACRIIKPLRTPRNFIRVQAI